MGVLSGDLREPSVSFAPSRQVKYSWLENGFVFLYLTDHTTTILTYTGTVLVDVNEIYVNMQDGMTSKSVICIPYTYSD